MKNWLVQHPSIWDIPYLVRWFMRSDSDASVIVPYTGMLSPFWAAVGSTIPLISKSTKTYFLNASRQSLLAMTQSRREKNQLDLIWFTSKLDQQSTLEDIDETMFETFLQGVCHHAAKDQVVSIFARVLDTCDHIDTLSRSGFQPAVIEHTYGLGHTSRMRSISVANLRPQTLEDTWHIYRLYKDITPSAVRRAENLTANSWSIEYTGQPRANRKLIKSFVITSMNEIAAWVRIDPGLDCPHRIQVMARPGNRNILQQLIGFAIGWLNQYSKHTILITARGHEPHIVESVESAGFHLIYSKILLVRHLAVPLPINDNTSMLEKVVR